jgi:DNA-binding response OmpR family regulator
VRVLVIAGDAEDRAGYSAALERAGGEVCGACAPPQATAQVRATQPDALLVVGPGWTTTALRLLLTRAREAAEAALPVVVILDGASVWLRAALPDDLAPAAAVAWPAEAATIQRAFASLAAGQPPSHRGGIGEVTVEYASRRLGGPAGEVWLTPSEAAVLAALHARPEAFVPTVDLARALWGELLTDRHARGAIRSHVHTLRGKLRAAGFTGAVESKPGVGYRLSAGGGD